jgi:hypothetical protein
MAISVSCTSITDYSLRLLIRSGIKSGKFSYQEVMSYAFGKWGFWYLSVIQFLFPFTGMLPIDFIIIILSGKWSFVHVAAYSGFVLHRDA